MSKTLKKTGYPYILLASLPMLVLGACASQEKTTAIEDEITPATEMNKPVNTVQDPIAMQQAHTTEFDSDKAKPVISRNEKSELNNSVAEETVLYPPTNKPQERLIGFGFDQSGVDEQYHELLKQHAQYLSENKDIKLKVSGHTDSFGPKEYNQYLSQKRAEAVAQLLVEFGAPEDRIVLESSADEEPLISAAHQREHRRVELDYQDQRLVSAE